MAETIVIPDDEGMDRRLPATYEVCEACRGRGKRVNPAIDGFSTMDECAQDEEFMEDYLSGVYDVICDECEGLRVVLVFDEARATPEQISAYEAHQREEWEYRRMAEMERRYGC